MTVTKTIELQYNTGTGRKYIAVDTDGARCLAQAVDDIEIGSDDRNEMDLLEVLEPLFQAAMRYYDRCDAQGILKEELREEPSPALVALAARKYQESYSSDEPARAQMEIAVRAARNALAD